MLTCEYSMLKGTAVIGSTERIGEVVITNSSSREIAMSYITHPNSNLDILFILNNRVVHTFHPADLHSQAKPGVLTLASGDSYRFQIGLAAITKDDLTPGKYRVKAVYKFQGIKYESNEVELTLTEK